MADEQKPDKAMAGMLKRKNVWPPASSGEVCPDAATLAAYFDRSLTAAEISQCESHFSSCLRCQEQLAALASSESASVATPAVEKRPAIFWLWDWRWMAPVGAAVVALVFFVSYKTMYAPVEPPRGSELMAKRDATPPVPAVAEPPKSAAPVGGKSDAAAGAAMKSLSVPPKDADRNELTAKDAVVKMDKLQRANEAAALEAARAVQAEKDKGRRLADAASGAVAGRAMPKPADEEKQIAAAENRAVAQPAAPPAIGAISPSAQAGPVQGAAPGAQAAQQRDQVVVAAERKEPEALAPSEVQAKELAALKKDKAAARQDAVPDRYALQTAPLGVARSRAASGELTVAVPNSKVIWRLGSAGRMERSRDAGKTWEAQKTPVEESLLSGSAPTENICWVGGSNGLLLRTTDGGETWERMPSPTKNAIVSVTAVDHLIVFVTSSDNHKFETRDAGAHWRAH